MPGLFVMSLLLFLVAAVAAVALVVWVTARRRAPAPPADDDEGHSKPAKPRSGTKVAGWTSVGALVLALVFLFFSSATIVSTKNVGIETSFGRPVGSFSNGFHLIQPWNKVTEMDAAIQTDDHVKDTGAFSLDPPVNVVF